MRIFILALSLILTACGQVDERGHKNIADSAIRSLEKDEVKTSINDLLVYSLAHQKNIDELFEIKELNTFLEKELVGEKEISNLKSLIQECHSIRGKKAICKRFLKEILENGYLD